MKAKKKEKKKEEAEKAVFAICLVLISAVIVILAGIFLFYPLFSQSNADELYSQAEEYSGKAYYNTAYNLYLQAREEYLRMGDNQKARKALLKMVKMKRITYEFPYNESEAEELIMVNFPNVSQDRRVSWLDEGYLQTLMSDGVKLYCEYIIEDFEKPLKIGNVLTNSW
jgi:hypothetical protein